MRKSDRIDEAAIEALATLGGSMGQKTFLEEVVETFATSTPPLLEKMRLALDDGDVKSLKAHAHSLKSSSALVGALHLSETCRVLETSADAESRDDVVRASKEFDDALSELRAIIGRQKVSMKRVAGR